MRENCAYLTQQVALRAHCTRCARCAHHIYTVHTLCTLCALDIQRSSSGTKLIFQVSITALLYMLVALQYSKSQENTKNIPEVALGRCALCAHGVYSVHSVPVHSRGTR
jgi:uncharacterized membrane protein